MSVDPTADGSLANLATKSRILVTQMAQSNSDPTAKGFARAVLNGETGYKAFVGVVMGPAFIQATQWDDATCREWVINHERSHGVLADTSRHGRSDGPRTAAFFGGDGASNADGLALLMKAGDSNGAGRCVDASKAVGC